MTEKNQGPAWYTPFAWIAGVAAVIPLAWAALQAIPGVNTFFIWLIDRMGPIGQAYLFPIMFLMAVSFAILYIQREVRVSTLKEERDSLEERLRSTEDELRQIEEERFRLVEEGVREEIWKRPVHNAPLFIDKGERRAKFVAFLNLKGGVGKTTLTGNLGVTLGLMDRPLDVLLIDIDFQATLSMTSVDPSALLAATASKQMSWLLLDPSRIPFDPKMLLSNVHLAPKVRILVTDSTLEKLDFQTQARYFLEPRFC